jgi:hypothetical protein
MSLTLASSSATFTVLVVISGTSSDIQVNA